MALNGSMGAVLVLGLTAMADSGGETACPVDVDQVAEPGLLARPAGDAGELSRAEWVGLHEAYERGRHAAFRLADGRWRVHNPGQRWRTSFEGRGFRVVPDARNWKWGLELERYGFRGSERRVTGAERVSAEGGRVVYVHDDRLEEWFINDRRGLEHGYTVLSRPEGATAEKGDTPLTFTLAVRGDLRPVVTANARGVLFEDATSGDVVLTYTGLKVTDATGAELEAGFDLVGERLRLSVDESGALYPVTIDPIVQQAYLKASNTGVMEYFGCSVAVFGTTAVVGAVFENSAATGVNGDQSDNSAYRAGAAYVFTRTGTTWSQQAYLKASNTEPGDRFGEAVAISSDTIVVGAMSEDSSATGVDGDQDDNFAGLSGAAYVFVRNGGTWAQQAYLKASNTDDWDGFGQSVAISGDTIVVGAWREDSSATGVDGDQSNNDAHYAGAAYVFVRNGTTWSQEAYLKAPNTDPDDLFGHSVSVARDTVVVGAHEEDSAAAGVNGDHADNSAPEAGAAYVYVRNETGWSLDAYLKASNAEADDRFGTSVAVSGDRIVVGADGEDSHADDVDGDQSNNDAGSAGAAYVFVRDGTSWSQEAYLKSPSSGIGEVFGRAVAIAGQTVLIGAPNENGPDYRCGGAYLYSRKGMGWERYANFFASNAQQWDDFADAVALSGHTVLIGAPDESSNATGVNGDQHNNNADNSGAAYVFAYEPTEPGVTYCFGDPDSGTPCPCDNDNDNSVPGSGCANGAFASGAQLLGSGTASLAADTVVLHATGLVPGEACLFWQGSGRLNGGDGITFGDGLWCVKGAGARLQIVVSDAAGTATTSVAIGVKGGVLPADTKRYQAWYRDNTGNQPCGPGVNDFNLSNAYQIVWFP